MYVMLMYVTWRYKVMNSRINRMNIGYSVLLQDSNYDFSIGALKFGRSR